MREGRSLSGQERHCCFLNTRDGRFATISAASGLDFPEDGRALGLTDWDHDGDTDVWIANRTGPRLRMMRNDLDEGRFVTVLLRGTTCNRDAIGARLELSLTAGQAAGGSPPPRRLVRTLAAGHGFLSQGSKRVHFGIAPGQQVEKLTIRWPDGKIDEFPQVTLNRHYVATQGQAELVEWRRPATTLALAQRELPGAPLSRQSRVVVNGRLPMPAIDYREIQPGTKPSSAAPLLVNLWSTTCAPCLEELQEMTAKETEIRAAGLSVVALNVDELANDPKSDLATARQLLTRLKFPFTAAAITPDYSGLLDLFHQSFLSLRLPLPVPSSFLATADGRVAVIYRGPVSIDQVLQDMALLEMGPDDLRAATVPFPGRWLSEPFQGDVQSLCTTFLRAGYLDMGRTYLEHYLLAHARNQGWGPKQPWPSRARLAELCDTLADFHRLKNDPQGVMKSYQVALQFDPNAALPHAMLGKGLIRAGQREKGLQMLERAVELDADNAELITDLAIGYAMMGRDREAIARLAALTDQRPELSSPHFHLARLYRQQRQYSDAIRELETYLRAEPTSSDAIYQLAWLLAAAPDEADRNPQRAREWFEQLPKSFPRDSLEYHDLDALLLAAAGDFDAAVRRTDEGLRRADAAATPATTPAPASVAAEEPPAAPRPPRTAADYLRARRELYARRQPYREPARGKSPAGAPGKPR